jgi:hypothetical protein
LNQKKSKLPKAAVVQMMSAAEELSKKSDKTAQEIFEQYLNRMDKYSDYFFSDPWPKKFDYKAVTTFTQKDVDFIDANEDEFLERVQTVIMKKNVSFEGFSVKAGLFWSGQAYEQQFIRPACKIVFQTFKELAKNGCSAEEILATLKERFEDISFIHLSFIENLGPEYLDLVQELKAAEILELIHTKEGYCECENSVCKSQREKRKNT